MFLLHMIFDHTRFVHMFLMKNDFLKELRVLITDTWPSIISKDLKLYYFQKDDRFSNLFA